MGKGKENESCGGWRSRRESGRRGEGPTGREMVVELQQVKEPKGNGRRGEGRRG